MTDDADFQGYLFQIVSPDVNAAGGVRRRVLYAIARSDIDLRKLPGRATLIAHGPDILEKARALGVPDDDFRMFDPE